MAVKGGEKLRAFIRKARAAQLRGAKKIEVGFFSTAKYPDGTPVTNVAAWNEFGTRWRGGGTAIPERPYFRQSIERFKTELRQPMIRVIDSSTMALTESGANFIGNFASGILRTQITRLRTPPNSPRTIRIKGSANPLIDEGFLKGSATHKVSM